MTELDIINATLASHPEGRSLLTKIRVRTNDTTYHDCEFLRRIVSIKFNLEKLETEGYTLQEILDGSDGFLAPLAHNLVLARIQQYIREQNPQAPPEPQPTTQQ